MANVLEIIKNEITQDYYKNNFPNDGQRFVAWYMRNIHLLDQRQAKDAITDGANDKQIDAVYIDEDEQKIYIVQGKYYLGESVDATPVREVISAWSQFSNLAQLQENANSKLKTKISEIATALEDDSYCVCFELITTSIFTDAAMDDIHSFQTKLSEEDDAELNYSTQFSVVDKQGLEDAYSCVIEQTNPTLNHTIKLEAGKYMTTELGATSVIVAAMPLKECIKLPGIKDGSLFQKNVRQSLGINNTVNKKIKKTINDPNKGIDIQEKSIQQYLDSEYVLSKVNLMKSMVKTNTDLALGSAKELLEIVCKSILSEKKISYTDDMTLSKLFKETINSVGILESSSASNKEQADRSIRQILSGLNSVIQGVSELRNGYGSGHGKEASFKRLEPQYVEFVVSIVSNIVVFILQINGETTPLQN